MSVSSRPTRWLLPLLAGCVAGDKLGGADSTSLPTDADTDTDTDTDTDSTPTGACTATITGLSPADGTASVSPASSVWATFSDPVPAAILTLDPTAPGTTTLAPDGRSATWTPTADLARATTYTATVSACDDTRSARFTTVGGAVAADLALRTYDLALRDPTDLAWLAPLAGPTLLSQLDLDHLLFMVEAADTTSIHWIGSAGVSVRGVPAQSACAAAVDFPVDDFRYNPAFVAGPVYLAVPASGLSVPLWDLTLAGEVAPDAAELSNLVLTAQLDVAPLSELLGADACVFVAAFGDACVPCPGGARTCLDVELHDAHAPRVDGLILDPTVVPDDGCD